MLGFLFQSKQTREQRLSFKVSMFNPGIILHETCGGSLEDLEKLLRVTKFTWDEIDTALANSDVQSAILKVHAWKAAFGWFGVNDAQACAEILMIELKNMTTDAYTETNTFKELFSYVTSMDLDISQLKANVRAELGLDNSDHHALYHVL